MPKTDLTLDVALGVTIPARDARGRVARLGPVLDAMLAATIIRRWSSNCWPRR